MERRITTGNSRKRKLVEIVIDCVPDWCKEAVELARERCREQAGTGCGWELSRKLVKESRHSDKSVRQPSYCHTVKSSRNHTEYDEDDDNGETREENIGNVESNEKGRESGHFVDMCDTATKDETNTDGSSNAAEHVGNIRPSNFGRKPLRQSACWFYAHGRCRSGDNCHFSHDGPLNRKGKARARRDSASAYALSSWNSGLSEDSDMKEETRKTKERVSTFANPQEVRE